MAFEQWLLDLGKSEPETLDELLVSILRRSDSAALTAVVAAVATSKTHLCPETLLALLSSPDCMLLDRGRLSMEQQAAGLVGILPHLSDSIKRIYDNERKQANGERSVKCILRRGRLYISRFSERSLTAERVVIYDAAACAVCQSVPRDEYRRWSSDETDSAEAICLEADSPTLS